MTTYQAALDDLDILLADLSSEEREEIEGASTALDVARLSYRAREHRSMTQSEAAKASGYKQQVVSRLEGGTANATFKTVERYLRRLGFALQLNLFDRDSAELIEEVRINWDAHTKDPAPPSTGVGLGAVAATSGRLTDEMQSVFHTTMTVWDFAPTYEPSKLQLPSFEPTNAVETTTPAQAAAGTANWNAASNINTTKDRSSQLAAA